MKNNRYFISLTCIIMSMLMIVLSLAVPVGALSTVSEADSTDKIDAALKEKMATASPDEKIGVYVWYQDIDHTSVEKEVKETTGLTRDTLSVNYAMPSVTMINGVKNKDPEAIAAADAYMKSTKELRRREQERTDTFVDTKRELSKAQYNAKSKKFISDNALTDSSVIFASQYAPMIIAELTSSEIANLSEDLRVDSISLCKEDNLVNMSDSETDESIADSITATLQISKNVTNNTKTRNLLGLTGEGVTVGMLEAEGHPDTSENNPELADVTVVKYGSSSSGNAHATYVANIIAGVNNGFAPDVTVYSTFVSSIEHKEPYFSRNLYIAIESMITDGVDIINCSMGTDREFNWTWYEEREQWYDHITAYHNVTFVSAASNRGKDIQLVGIGAMGYNSITVGAYYDKGTLTYTDDQQAGFSSFLDSSSDGTGGVEKPDVIMPGFLYDKDGEAVDIEGTSYAAPMLVGALAQMFELKPSLKAFPQAVKAIVLASCHRKVLPSTPDEAAETMVQGITERQGAGAPDIWTMACIICQGTYGIGTMSTTDTTESRRFSMPSYGAQNMNVSLAWMREVIRTNEGNTVAIGTYASEEVNMDLAVYRNNSTTAVGTSSLARSSAEMTYFSLDSTCKEYEIRITKPVSAVDVRYGYAYSTDNMSAAPVSTDGIYRIKNLETGQYMTLDPLTNEVKLQSYTDSTTQQWILKSNAVYQVSSAYGSTPGIFNIGDTVDTTSMKVVLGNSTLNFTGKNWDAYTIDNEKGAFFFYTYDKGNQLILKPSGNSLVLSTTAETTDCKYWILEESHYRRGDANANGVYNVSDATRIQKYLAGEVTLSNAELFLADANYDGSVTSADETRIREVLAGLYIY